jgi:dephospho-CoA kinase
MNTTVVGLTGGIASGKTTAARHLCNCGFEVIDADVLAKHVFEEHLQEIRQLFPEIIGHSPEDFRARLASEVFAKPEARHKLNALMHPAIRTRMKAQQRQFEAEGVAVVFYDAPLLFETGGDAFVEATLLIYAPFETQLRRLMKRSACSEEHATQRIQSQINIESKRQRATWVVENLGSREELHRKLDAWREEELSAFLAARLSNRR